MICREYARIVKCNAVTSADKYMCAQSPRNTYQCISANEPVWMADGSHKPLWNVSVGDEILTFDPATMASSTTTVIHHHVADTDKPIMEVITTSGRRITATHDHLFMTSNGWLPVEAMTGDTTVAVSLEPVPMSPVVPEALVLTRTDVILAGRRAGVKATLLEKHASILEARGLLPLWSTSPLLPILARLAGFTLGDGSLGVNKGGRDPKLQASLSSEEAASDYLDDIQRLGFCRNTANYRETFVHGVAHHAWHVQYSGAPAVLMIALDLPTGRRTHLPSLPVPRWITLGSLSVQREFMAGIQGADGCKIRWNRLRSGCNFICAWTSMSKTEEHSASLYAFMSQLEDILNTLGVETLGVKTTRVDCMVQMGVKVRDTQENLITLFRRVGYRYDYFKLRESAPVVEYLQYLVNMRSEERSLIRRAAELRDQGMSLPHVALAMDMSTHLVTCLLKRVGKHTQLRLRADQQPEKWLTKLRAMGRFLFVPVAQVAQRPNVLIGDLTTASDNHSFIANGFAVHNSAMSKQAIGMYAGNYRSRFDSTSAILDYPQRPLVSTAVAKEMKMDELPSGCNPIVAILSWDGYNQEVCLPLPIVADHIYVAVLQCKPPNISYLIIALTKLVWCRTALSSTSPASIAGCSVLR